MDSINDILQQKAAQLDIAANRDILQIIQAELDRLYGKNHVTVHKIINDTTLIVHAASASQASVVRYEQRKLLEILRGGHYKDLDLQKIIIKIIS